jgi:hypothetical protein
MSINQMLQSNSPPSPTLNDIPTFTGKGKKKKKILKYTCFSRGSQFSLVKIFYTFKGSDKHCLCTFDLKINDFKDKKWISVPLRQCLYSVCSSW